jgi:hypothetical protein
MDKEDVARPGQDPSAEWPEAAGADGVRLQAALEQLGAEVERLTDELGVAVLDGHDGQLAMLEARLDGLAARRAGLAAELAALRAAAEPAERERRRRESAERERERRTLVALRAELYEGWGALLEHRAAVAELALELERLRAAVPIDPARLRGLREQLEAAGLTLEPLLDGTAGTDDPEAIRAAAHRCRELARAADSGRAEPTIPTMVGAEAGAGAEPSAGGHAGAGHEPDQMPAVGEAQIIEGDQGEGDQGEGDHAAISGPPGVDRRGETVAGSARSSMPAKTIEGAVGEELRQLDAEQQRLEQWAATLEARGDPLGVHAEVTRQLAAVVTRREALEVQVRGAEPSNDRAEAHWLRFMRR